METNSLSGASMLYYLVHDLTTAPPYEEKQTSSKEERRQRIILKVTMSSSIAIYTRSLAHLEDHIFSDKLNLCNILNSCFRA